jgi:hypothetical protein
MVAGWVAIASWLSGWTLMAWISLGLLKKLRPGERVPMQWGKGGTVLWRASPALAALLTPTLSVVAGLVTIVVSYLYGGGRAPLMNVILPLIFILAHAMHVHMAIRTLEHERDSQ